MSSEATIRIVVVDDHPLVRVSMGYFLAAFPDFQLIGSAAGGDEALDLVAQTQPDIVLMDVQMPGMDGIAATRQITTRFPSVTVIALSGHDDSDLVRRMLRAGARSYLLKSVSALELAAAVRATRAGRCVLAPEIQHAVLQTMAAEEPVGNDLSQRERDVLGLLVHGLDNDAIAQRLVISRSTAKFHLRHIFDKLNVSNRAAAIVVAYRHKLV